MTIFPDGYKNAFLCELSGAGLAAVATKENTSDIYFAKSNDGGATWSTPALIGTLASGKAAQVHIGSNGALIVTNGVDTIWRSDNFGRTWSAL